jgi:hypothetical protein
VHFQTSERWLSHQLLPWRADGTLNAEMANCTTMLPPVVVLRIAAAGRINPTYFGTVQDECWFL